MAGQVSAIKYSNLLTQWKLERKENALLRDALKAVEKKMVFCLSCDRRLDNFGERKELIELGYEIDHAEDCQLAIALAATASDPTE